MKKHMEAKLEHIVNEQATVQMEKLQLKYVRHVMENGTINLAEGVRMEKISTQPTKCYVYHNGERCGLYMYEFNCPMCDKVYNICTCNLCGGKGWCYRHSETIKCSTSGCKNGKIYTYIYCSHNVASSHPVCSAGKNCSGGRH